MLDKNANSLFVYSIIVLIMVCVVVFTPKVDRKPKNVVLRENVLEKFNIDNNYQIDIEENDNGKVNTYIYYTDSKLELYEGSNISNGYLKYKDKLYLMDGKTYKIKEVKDFSFVEKYYYDISFIKELVNNCNFEYVNSNSVSCEVKRSDYFNLLNTKYNTSYGDNGEDSLKILLSYGNMISNIKIDYSINNYVKEYNLKISNIGKNNFDEIYKEYKDILE